MYCKIIFNFVNLLEASLLCSEISVMSSLKGGRRSREWMVVGFTITYAAISAYHHWCCDFESRSGRGVQHYVIKFVSDLRQWFSPCTPVSSINKTDRHDITEILLKVALNTIKANQTILPEASLSCTETSVMPSELCFLGESCRYKDHWSTVWVTNWSILTNI